MTHRPRLIAACGDPGGAAALAPVVARLMSDGRVSVEAHGYAQGPAVWEKHGIEVRRTPDGVGPDWFNAVLEAASPELVLVSTSHNGRDDEKEFVRAARGLGVRSLGVLDYWSNYAVRFSDRSGQLNRIPDRVAVMDETARNALLACGIPSQSIFISGQPALDGLCATDKTHAARIRRELGLRDDEVFVLFASQPLRSLYATPEGPSSLGYDEFSVLGELVRALEALERDDGRSFALVVRPHPREEAERLEGRGGRLGRYVVSGQHEARDVAQAADLVVGMTSMLLVEAAYLGCRVVSLQPGRVEGSGLPDGVAAMMTTVDRAEGVREAIRFGLGDAWHVHATRAPEDATGRVVGEVYRLLFDDRADDENSKTIGQERT